MNRRNNYDANWRTHLYGQQFVLSDTAQVTSCTHGIIHFETSKQMEDLRLSEQLKLTFSLTEKCWNNYFFYTIIRKDDQWQK